MNIKALFQGLKTRVLAASCGADEAVDIAKHLEGAISTNYHHYGPNGNVFFRPMMFPKAGDKVQGHAHTYDHVSFLWTGAVHLKAFKLDEKGNQVGEVIEKSFNAPARILIKKNMSHAFTALVDNTHIDCIYALRGFDGQVTDEWNGDMTPYV